MRAREAEGEEEGGRLFFVALKVGVRNPIPREPVVQTVYSCSST